MQRTGETYTEYQKRVLCENSSKLGGHPVVTPQCLDGGKEYRVEVLHHRLDEPGEGETMSLCGDCKDRVKRDAEGHGYRVLVKKL